MRRTSYLRWAALLAAVFLLSGCAVLTKQELKPAPETLSQGRFVYLADRACARAERGLKGHRNPRSYDEALRDLQKLLIPAYERLLFDLHGLAPPPSEAVAYRRLLATLNNEDLVIHHTVDALGQLQRQRVKTGLRRLGVLDRRVAVRAKRVGLKTCGKK
jgi:hypothetical protein